MLDASAHDRRSSVFVRYGLAAGAVGLALCLELVIRETTGAHYVFIALAPAIAFGAWFGGLGPGIVAIALALIGTVKFSLGSRLLLHVDRPADSVALATFAVCWLLVSILAGRVYNRLRREGEWRLEAERIAGHADRLQQFTAALAGARTRSAAIQACVQEALYWMKADAGAVLLVSDDGRFAAAAAAIGYDQAEVDHWRQVPLDAGGPIADAVRRRSPVLLETRQAALREYGRHESVQASAHEGTICLPLSAGGRVIAVLRLDYDRPRLYTEDDGQFLDAIAPRAAEALDRTAQYEAAQRARAEAERERARADEELAERQRAEQALRASEARYRALAARTSRLHGLAAALSEAATLDAVARALVHQSKIVVGATAASVMLLAENGTRFETMYAEDEDGGHDDKGGFSAVEGLCATAAVQRRRPILVSSFDEWQQRYWRSASSAADGGYVSSATLPLLVESRVVGVVEFHFTVPVNFDDEYETLLVSVAHHCAQALDRARLYEAAQQARAEAETANRLKDDFLSVVSHELRTPLNSILGWASMMQKGQLDAALSARALQAINDNATRQAKLVEDLLDFSRIAAGRAPLDLEAIDLAPLLRGVVDSVLPVATAKGVELEVGELCAVPVRGDVRRLEQVFFNLLGNALKFTPSGGRVQLEMFASEGGVDVRVTDTGVGIDEAFLPHVFDRFRQGDSTITRNYGGLGLGLSIARQLIEAHRGTITVESPGAGQGAVFTVHLPAAAEGDKERRPAAAPAQATVQSVPPPRLEGVHVLIVDDEADAREMMACALATCGAKVTVAERAEEALQILGRSEVDVLLADIAMPGQDGYALIRRIRASSVRRVSSVPAIAVTAHARDDERRHALESGFHRHVAKPFEPTALAHTVRDLLARPRSGASTAPVPPPA